MDKLYFQPFLKSADTVVTKSTSQDSGLSICGSYNYTPIWDGQGFSLCFYNSISSGLYLIMFLLVTYQALRIKKYV